MAAFLLAAAGPAPGLTIPSGLTSSVCLSRTPSGRGLVAVRQLQADEAALVVPTSMTLHVEKDSGVDSLAWPARLALRLAEEMRLDHESVHRDYLRSLPAHPPLLLHRWSTAQLSQLQNATLEAEAAEWRGTADEAWRAVEPRRRTAGDAPAVCEKVYQRAYDFVLSRAMSQHADPRIFLVPYVDLANHRAGSGGQFTVADDWARLVTSAAVAEGAEVTLDYGGRPSDELLLQYGFVPARNDEDGVTLRGEDGAVECVVTWEDVRAQRVGAAARERCAALLDMMPTSLAEDVDSLRDLEGRVTPAAAAEEEEEQSAEEGGGSLEAALRYRILKKQLLAAAAGQPASSPGSSAFAVRKQ